MPTTPDAIEFDKAKVRQGKGVRLRFPDDFADMHATVTQDAGGRSAAVTLEIPGDEVLAPTLTLMQRRHVHEPSNPVYAVACSIAGVPVLTIMADRQGEPTLVLPVDGEGRSIPLSGLENLIRQLDELERLAGEAVATQKDAERVASVE